MDDGIKVIVDMINNRLDGFDKKIDDLSDKFDKHVDEIHERLSKHEINLHGIDFLIKHKNAVLIGGAFLIVSVVYLMVPHLPQNVVEFISKIL